MGDDFLSRALGHGVGLLAIRLIALAWLLVDLTERHRLGALRVLLLGVPILLLSLAFSALFAFAWWLWFTTGFALDILRWGQHHVLSWLPWEGMTGPVIRLVTKTERSYHTPCLGHFRATQERPYLIWV